MSSYATVQDAITYGLVPSTRGLDITDAQIQANLDARSDWADTRLGGRYSLPILAPYPASLVRAVVHMARYDIIALRGFDETNPADKNVVETCKAAEKLLDDVLRQQAHFGVIESPAPTSLITPKYAAPLVMSMPLQGWLPGQDTNPPDGGSQGVL